MADLLVSNYVSVIIELFDFLCYNINMSSERTPEERERKRSFWKGAAFVGAVAVGAAVLF